MEHPPQDGKSLYEIPTCPICISEELSELSATKCGHVFHTHCIMQSLETRSVCPVCREKNIISNLRNLNYSIQIIKEDTEFQKFFKALKEEDQNQMVSLMNKNQELFKDNAKHKRELENVSEKAEEKERQFSILSKKYEDLRKYTENTKNKKKIFKMENQNIMLKMKDVVEEKEKLTIRINSLEGDLKDLQKMKKMIESLKEDEDTYLKLVKEKYPFQEQARYFYETLCMKKGELSKLKQELEKVKMEKDKYSKEREAFTEKIKEVESLKQENKTLVQKQENLRTVIKRLKEQKTKEKELNSAKENQIEKPKHILERPINLEEECDISEGSVSTSFYDLNLNKMGEKKQELASAKDLSIQASDKLSMLMNKSSSSGFPDFNIKRTTSINEKSTKPSVMLKQNIIIRAEAQPFQKRDYYSSNPQESKESVGIFSKKFKSNSSGTDNKSYEKNQSALSNYFQKRN